MGDTVRGLLTFVDRVVVVDDGSRDDTATVARAAGAQVLRSARTRGKGGAVEAALTLLEPASVWLFADADLGKSAEGLAAVVNPVRGGHADLAIAVLPPQAGGGMGTVRRGSAWAIHRLVGFEARAPLSGQRALTATCLRDVRPLAPGFGVEAAMTVDAVRAGARVEEVDVRGLEHRATGRGVRGFAHRGRQGWDIARALARRLRA